MRAIGGLGLPCLSVYFLGCPHAPAAPWAPSREKTRWRPVVSRAPSRARVLFLCLRVYVRVHLLPMRHRSLLALRQGCWRARCAALVPSVSVCAPRAAALLVAPPRNLSACAPASLPRTHCLRARSACAQLLATALGWHRAAPPLSAALCLRATPHSTSLPARRACALRRAMLPPSPACVPCLTAALCTTRRCAAWCCRPLLARCFSLSLRSRLMCTNF